MTTSRFPSPSPVPGACSWSSSLLPLGSQLLFAGNCGGAASARSLFALDAPGAAPRLVRAFTAAGRLTAWGSERVAFTEGSALWITDGTTGGTVEAEIVRFEYPVDEVARQLEERAVPGVEAWEYRDGVKR